MTLKEYIHANGPLHPKEAVRIMEQVVAAMEEAHAKQLVHRDIKPHNILIDNMGNIKVTDFGIAIALSSATITHTNSVLGSVHYLSPEQARGGLATKSQTSIHLELCSMNSFLDACHLKGNQLSVLR